MKELITLRHRLHQYPEVSNDEKHTASLIEEFVTQYNPDEIVRNVGGAGIFFVFNGTEAGPTVAIRSELDALPIQEINTFEYKSQYKGVSHKCGHDGHMTIVSGLASYLHMCKPKKGRVVLLFQPAEETGEGARQIVNDVSFSPYEPDFIFALHNLPGVQKDTVVIYPDVFGAASKGIILNLEGTTSHAAEPENGISPAITIADIIKEWSALNHLSLDLKELAFITVVHVKLGEPAFGVSPGNAQIMATIRAYNDNDLAAIENEALDRATRIAQSNKLELDFSERETFSATINDEYCNSLIEKAAITNGYELVTTEKPNSWSEDFGIFTQKYNGAMFGLGAGENTPDLHNPDYDFPDELIPTGKNMFIGIINQLLY